MTYKNIYGTPCEQTLAPVGSLPTSSHICRLSGSLNCMYGSLTYLYSSLVDLYGSLNYMYESYICTAVL